VRIVPRAEIYARTGIQFMQINSLYQLFALARAGSTALEAARTLLMMPDLFRSFLTGERCCEYTDATTTQFVALADGDWDRGLLGRLGLPVDLLPRWYRRSAAPCPWPEGSARRSGGARQGRRRRRPRHGLGGPGRARDRSRFRLPQLRYLVPVRDGGGPAVVDERSLGGTSRTRAGSKGATGCSATSWGWAGRGMPAGLEPGRVRRALRGARRGRGRLLPSCRSSTPTIRASSTPETCRPDRGVLRGDGASGARGAGANPPLHPREPGAQVPVGAGRTERLAGKRFPGLHVVGGGSRNALLCG
jgi:hypothetical protein